MPAAMLLEAMLLLTTVSTLYCIAAQRTLDGRGEWLRSSCAMPRQQVETMYRGGARLGVFMAVLLAALLAAFS